MENLQQHPFKLYIQDIFRAKRSENNKYIYNIFGLNFKNIMIHGVVTAVYNKMKAATNLELSDPTGSVQIYFDTRKFNRRIPEGTLKSLFSKFAEETRRDSGHLDIMTTMLDAIAEKSKNPIEFQEGSYVSVVGDIFIDDLREVRMVSAFDCRVSSVQRDILWLEELRYLYEKFYLWNKVDSVAVKIGS